ncbi:MAG: HNH endonuclease [Methylocella sp.]
MTRERAAFRQSASLLTAERLRTLVRYNSKTGIFTRNVRSSTAMPGNVAGSHCSNGYLEFRVDGRKYLAHRLAFLYTQGTWPIAEIDHVDNCPSNNRWNNLREATRSQNLANTRARIGHKGVCWHKNRKKWYALIKVSGKNHHLGCCDTPEAAYELYIAATKRLFGQYAKTKP